MSGWSHRGRRRKLAPSPGVALRSTQVGVVSAPSLTCVGGTRKGRKRKEHVVCLSVTPFLKAFFFAAQHSKLHRSPSLDQQWLLHRSGVTLRQTTRSFRFLPFRVSPTHVSDGAETIRTCVDLRATPGDRASFLSLHRDSSHSCQLWGSNPCALACSGS